MKLPWKMQLEKQLKFVIVYNNKINSNFLFFYSFIFSKSNTSKKIQFLKILLFYILSSEI